MERCDFEILKSDINYEFSNSMLESFGIFANFMLEKNKVMNLTAITAKDEVINKHFYDSLKILDLIDFDEIESIADIGTGAGFPGVPLAIALPDIQFYLIDSQKKRIDFINEAINLIGINNITAVWGRAEDLAKTELRESMDICLSRAVADLSVLSEYSLPFVKIGGSFIAWKSNKYSEELDSSRNAILTLGGEFDEVFKYNNSIDNVLVKITKTKPTPTKYPRRAGMPTKRPL